MAGIGTKISTPILIVEELNAFVNIEYDYTPSIFSVHNLKQHQIPSSAIKNIRPGSVDQYVRLWAGIRLFFHSCKLNIPTRTILKVYLCINGLLICSVLYQHPQITNKGYTILLAKILYAMNSIFFVNTWVCVSRREFKNTHFKAVPQA